MKLFHNVMWHISVASIVIMIIWSIFFYWALIDEINDEVDDSLDDYSEMLIIKELNGEEMPSANNGSNNQYYIYDVSDEYAMTYPNILYRDEMVYIESKLELEPARVLITIFKTDEGYKELVVYTPTIDKLDLKQAILGWMIVLFVGIFLILLLLNIWVFRRNMKPFYKLLSWFRGYKIGNGYVPLSNTTNITEFNNLYKAIMMSVDSNERLYEQQRLFIGNASHELQTPLASSLNRLEMILDDDTLSESQLKEIVKVYDTLDRMSRINKSLLMLCKIENGQYDTDIKEISFCRLIDYYIDMYNEIYEYKHIDVVIDKKSPFIYNINESLANILVSNLIKNAYLHNDVKGKVRITITESCFIVESSGASSLDPKMVFQRFYQGSKKEGSTGLGLALVDTICRVNRLEIFYVFNDGMHIFSVSCKKK